MCELRHQGLKQGICAYPDSPIGKKSAEHGYPIVTPRKLLFFPWIGKNWDICHAHDGRGVYLAALAHRACSTPYIITRRESRVPTDRTLTRRVYREAAELIGISSQVCDALREIAPSASIHRITDAHSNGEPNRNQARILRKRWLGDAQFLIGHAGALVDKHKGQSTLIQAVQQLNKSGHRIRLVLMGTGPDQSALQTLSGNDPAIQFVGQMKPIHDALAALDLFVFPSRYEALGSVLLETMLCQTPIIAANVGGIPDLIQHDFTGLLCPPNDPETLACVITNTLEDQESRERLANAAYAHVKELSADAMAKDYMQLYTKITGYLRCV